MSPDRFQLAADLRRLPAVDKVSFILERCRGRYDLG